MNKQEAIRRLDALEAEAKKLREIINAPEARPIAEGWEITRLKTALDFSRSDKGGQWIIARVDKHGLTPIAGAGKSLDGIAHDPEGRIKVVGYVNAEDLKKRLRGSSIDDAYNAWNFEQLSKIIDELKG